jgi:hypothetical protein
MSGKRCQGRRQTKAKPRLFRFRLDLDDYLERQARKEGRTLTGFVEFLIEYRSRFKDLPR